MATPTKEERCLTKKVELLVRNVVVRELTVAEVESVFEGMRSQDLQHIKLHIIDMLFQLPFPSVVVEISTGETLNNLVAEYTQEELGTIIDGVVEVNHRLKKMYARLVEVGQEAMRKGLLPSSSVGSSGSDTPTPGTTDMAISTRQ